MTSTFQFVARNPNHLHVLNNVVICPLRFSTERHMLSDEVHFQTLKSTGR